MEKNHDKFENRFESFFTNAFKCIPRLSFAKHDLSKVSLSRVMLYPYAFKVFSINWESVEEFSIINIFIA